MAKYGRASSQRPASGKGFLREISDKAFWLIKIIELERSGIREGDGCWHGSDVVGGIMNDLRSLFQLLDGFDRRNRESACDWTPR